MHQLDDEREGRRQCAVGHILLQHLGRDQLAPKPIYPSIIADYKNTFAWARRVTADVFLAPHPEMYGMLQKHAQIAQGGPNPFVKPGEFNTHVESQEKAFEAALAKQMVETKQK